MPKFLLLLAALLLCVYVLADDPGSVSGRQLLKKRRRRTPRPTPRPRAPLRPTVQPSKGVQAIGRTLSPTLSADCTLRMTQDCRGNCRVTSAHAGALLFQYGCQANDFCAFRMGNAKQQRAQCLMHPPCIWSPKAVCTSSNSIPPSSPSAPTVDPWLCYDGCFSAKNGICEDGGPGSTQGFCPFGSDCTDCGPR
jgi:hypothetical protein